jgi:hypothetical protein
MRAVALAFLAFTGDAWSQESHASDADIVQRMACDLQFPERAHIEAVSEYTHVVVPEEDRARALVHLRGLVGSWDPRDANERDWLAQRRYTSAPEWRPAIISSWNRGGTAIHRADSLDLATPWTRLVSRETVRMPDGDHWTVVHSRASDGVEIVNWFGDDGGPRRIVRELQIVDRGAFYGAFYALMRLDDLVSVSLSAAREDGSMVVSELGDRLTWWLDLSRPANLLRMPDSDIPPGFEEIPSHLSGEYLLETEQRILVLDWRDASMGMLSRHSVTWTTPGSLPTSIECTEYVPGSEHAAVTWHVRFLTTALEVPADELRWRSRPGDYVVDRRFEPPLSYHIDESGELPSEAALRTRAAKLKASVVPTVAVHEATLDCASGELHGRESSQRLGVTSVALGTHRPAAVVPVEIEIVNKGTSAIELGDVRADCGCIAPVLTSRTIPARGAVILTVRQQMRSPGKQVTHLTIPIRSGARGSLDVEFRAVVSEAPDSEGKQP